MAVLAAPIPVDPVKRPATHSAPWQNIISAPLEEGFIPLFLTNIGLLIDEHFLLAPKHLQLLLYFVLVPPAHNKGHTPLALLHHFLALHTPAHFGHCLPKIPRSSEDREYPAWLDWEAIGQPEKECQEYLERHTTEGVWGLLWVRPKKPNSNAKQGSRSRKRLRLEEEEEDAKVEPVVGEQGWEILGWLLVVWEKDQAECARDRSDEAYSPLLLEQLSRPHSVKSHLQIDNLDAPFLVIKQALEGEPGTAAQDLMRRRQIGMKLLDLLLNTALARQAPVNPSSLILSLLQLMRKLSYGSFSAFLPVLTSRIPRQVLLHVVALSIEDIAGVRRERTEKRNQQAARRRKLRPGAPIVDDDDEDLQLVAEFPYFRPPTVLYALGLLRLKPKVRRVLAPDMGDDDITRTSKMMLNKLTLLSAMMSEYPPTIDVRWRKAFEQAGDEWSEQVEAALHLPDLDLPEAEGKKLASIAKAILSLVQIILSRSRQAGLSISDTAADQPAVNPNPAM